MGAFKFWMILTPDELIRERIKDWCRDHPGASAKEVSHAFNLGYPGIRRQLGIIKKEWRRELRDSQNAKNVKMFLSKRKDGL